MNRRFLVSIVVAIIASALPAAAHAAISEPQEYRLESASAGVSTTQAGAHPDFTLDFQLSENSEGFPHAFTRDFVVTLPPGMIGNPDAFPKCSTLQFGTKPEESECPQDSQIGSIEITLGGQGTFHNEPIYNLEITGGGMAAHFGFYAGPFPVFLNARLDPKTHQIVASVEGASAGGAVVSGSTRFWGVPADKSHNSERITPEESLTGTGPPGGRESTQPMTPFMTNPTSCVPGQTVGIVARSYQLPEQPSAKSAPFPQITGCGALEFNPTATLSPTTTQATTGSGLDYVLDVPAKGMEFANLLYGSELNRAEVILPAGMTVNPSEAEGLGVCSEAEVARETYDSGPNAGCPETSKIGTVVADSPALDLPAEGSLYLAKPYENPFGTLLALYMVLKIPSRGVIVELPGKVIPDPLTGQLTTTFEEIPQVPVSEFKLHFREGSRAPLITPPACGSFTAMSNLSPWAAPASVLAKPSTFQIESGPNHGPCPSGGLPPFHPGLGAGTVNNAAGAYSPFDLRLTRTDSEQEITHFSIKLPPGVIGKLAGIPYCSDLSIAAAKAREGKPHGGDEELTNPSCPAASQIGTTLVGAGVGETLVYVPGKIYLAGPYHGSNLSIVAITAAKAGPFDLGTVVVHEALKVNPETAEVFVDAAGSDPIPHIINGIPVHLRDIRAYVDRPEFVLNPTSCEPTSTASTVLGSGTNFASEADDRPVTVTSRFQAADCASLAFGPKLQLSLKGATKRAGLPKLKAVVTPRPGDANIGRTVVTLPQSEFLEQGHIGTVCTRVQFNAGGGNGEQCPAKSVYGHAVATTPLLSESLTGPVFLRSNGGERRLPDLVAALHSKDINVDLQGFISSLHAKGSDVSRIRTIFAAVPDAPVSRFTLEMFGGKKGLLVNSTNLCKGTHKAISEFTGQNGKRHDTEPAVKAQCGKKGKKAKKNSHHKKAGAKGKGNASPAAALRHRLA